MTFTYLAVDIDYSFYHLHSFKMQLYWQSKIFALLHDPIFKPFHRDKSTAGLWRELDVMQDFPSEGKLLQYLKNADYISAASDRGAIGNISARVNVGAEGVELSHLLSGAKQRLQVSALDAIVGNDRGLRAKERELFPESIERETDPQKVFWWLWRCLPTAVCQQAQDTSLLLMPADTRIPDTSLWSHTSMTAALAGASIGYQTTMAEFNATHAPKSTYLYEYYSHPHLVSFSFAPVQDLIKSSRKMRDFWAGSWILHYLSAKISWKLACKYGPDALLYPSLFHQPLIDSWLLQSDKYPDFKEWIKQPLASSLLTAGFPNVLVLVLPEGEVRSAMQMASQELKDAWRDLGDLVFEDLQASHWTRELERSDNCWRGWLDAQWQIYWTGVPIGNTGKHFRQANNNYFADWVKDLNQTYGLTDPQPTVEREDRINLGLFTQPELNLLAKYDVNVGSWWGYIFDTTRLTANSVKNARNWKIPTVFSTRSTISGLGAAVHDRSSDWAKEGEVKQFWQNRGGLFDGREQLNATEIIKRGLHRVLDKVLRIDRSKLAIAYPDLTAGVAGYLNHNDDAKQYYISSCEAILAGCKLDKFRTDDYKWGIPWAEKNSDIQKYHPRLLNAGWLIEDLDIPIDDTEQLQQCRLELNAKIDGFYPGNNPTDWYVLAAGDGDGMNEWLKGLKLAPYSEYVASELSESEELGEFLKIDKRMGPATHNALSRALLDFSNQLVPYLTETRYAGRLIYAGGDDVLAYTNLWEWDDWLWDISECFRGRQDPGNEFRSGKSNGDYWQ